MELFCNTYFITTVSGSVYKLTYFHGPLSRGRWGMKKENDATAVTSEVAALYDPRKELLFFPQEITDPKQFLKMRVCFDTHRHSPREFLARPANEVATQFRLSGKLTTEVKAVN